MGIMMEKRLPGLDLDALRSFVTGMECGSFAQAALRLSRSTSAVSAQLKKLESQCGTALVTKQGRHLVLSGRNAPDWLVEAADLVTSMTEIKHPWRTGIKAAPGIEY